MAANAGPDARTETTQDATHELVRDYYGKRLERSEDLQTNACCTASAPDAAMRGYLANLHEETAARYFGCGLIAPEAVDGARVLDLGCGAGRDVYALAQMVGEDGFVAGVDMTAEQLEVAERHKDWHMRRFGYGRANVAFHHGLLERLEETPLAPGSFDVAISNCVINLVTDKAATLAGVRRLLSEGGEFYFSDVYADREPPAEVRADPLLYGECLGGALEWRRFLELAREAGFATPRLVSAETIAPTSPELERKLGGVRFASATYRLFAMEVGSDAAQESWTARYRGGASGAERALLFDHAHRFEAGESVLVDGEAAALLSRSRFAPYFDLAPADGDAPGAAEATSPFAILADAAPKGGCCG